jgi:hypothetical protein
MVVSFHNVDDDAVHSRSNLCNHLVGFVVVLQKYIVSTTTTHHVASYGENYSTTAETTIIIAAYHAAGTCNFSVLIIIEVESALFLHVIDRLHNALIARTWDDFGRCCGCHRFNHHLFRN